MADAKPITLRAYESAYPGSMFERADGGYIERDDAESLASGLLALIKSGDRAAEDAGDALAQANLDLVKVKAQRDAILPALEAAYAHFGDWTFDWPGRITPAGQTLLGLMRDAIAVATGRTPQEVQDDYGTRAHRAKVVKPSFSFGPPVAKGNEELQLWWDKGLRIYLEGVDAAVDRRGRDCQQAEIKMRNHLQSIPCVIPPGYMLVKIPEEGAPSLNPPSTIGVLPAERAK